MSEKGLVYGDQARGTATRAEALVGQGEAVDP